MGYSGTTAVKTTIPIRLRVGSNINTYQGQVYSYTPFAGQLITGPVVYGTSFIQSWFEDQPAASSTI